MDNNRYFSVLYGDCSPFFTDWVRFSETVAERTGRAYTNFHVTLENDKSSDRLYKYSVRAIKKRIEYSEIRFLSLYSVHEPYSQVVFDWQLVLIYDRGKNELIAGTNTNDVTWDCWKEISTELMDYTKLTYGYGGQLHYTRGPIFYVNGFGTGTAEEDKEDLRAWIHEMRGPRRFEQGYFRQAYRLNLLSPAHLSKLVGDLTVRQAIEKGKLPGKLEDVRDGCAMWLLEEEETDTATEMLQEHGLLVRTLPRIN